MNGSSRREPHNNWCFISNFPTMLFDFGSVIRFDGFELTNRPKYIYSSIPSIAHRKLSTNVCNARADQLSSLNLRLLAVMAFAVHLCTCILFGLAQPLIFHFLCHRKPIVKVWNP